MSGLYTLDLGVLNEAQRGTFLSLRADVSAGILASLRSSLLSGDALSIRRAISFLLAVDDTSEAVDAALSHVLPESQARLFAWLRVDDIMRRPFVFDLIDSAAYKALFLAQAVLE